MTRKWSRRLSISLLAAMMLAVMLAGCSGGNRESANPPATSDTNTTTNEDYGDTGGLKLPLVDKPVELTWMVVSDNTRLNDSLVIKEIERRTGIQLNIQAYPSATYGEKLKAVVASGKLPDLFHGLTMAEINKMGAQGVLTPINKYLDQLPNFKQLYVDNPENNWVMKTYSDDKGNIYPWPMYGVNRDVNHGFLYRKDIFDKNNIKLWTNTDEFYQALKKLKEIYPNSYPYASKTKEYIFRDWGYGWGVVNNEYPAFFDEKTHQWKFTFTQPEYKDMLDFMKKLYNEGLIDPEFLTDTEASWTSKMTNDKSFVTFDWIGRLDMFYNQVKDNNPNYNLRYGNPVGPSNKIRSLPKISSYGLVVTNNEKKEAALKLLDYLSSPSGAELIMLGVKGKSFDIDANGKVVYPELKDVPNVDIKMLEEKYGCWVEGMYLRADKRSVYFNFTEKEQEAQDMMKGKMEPLDPMLKFTDEENKTKADLYPELYKAAVEFSTQYVLTKSYGDKEWQDWLEKAKKLGVDKYIDLYNQAQKRYDAQ